jgi:hypothetical protein
VRYVRGHLAEGDKNEVAHETDERVAEQEAERTTAHERGTAADDQAGADRTAEL